MSVICYFIFTILSYRIVSVYSLSNATINDIPDTFANLTAGNDLWSGLLRNCKNLSLSCIRNNIYEYLKDILDYGNDIEVTNSLKFSKNSVDYSKLQMPFEEPLNQTEDSAPLIEDETPISEISRSLYDNAIKFLMSHNVEVLLPEMFFPGTILKVSPRTFEDDGALVKLELLPKTVQNSVGEGRIFFKKIKKFVSERLIYALLAILLVIKLLAVKILFVLPTIVGVAAAKKLLLKVLLFLFPALHHLFKLCAYVPHGAKHHIHKHQIAHIHEISHGHHHHHGSHSKHHEHEEVILPHAEGPPSLHHYSNANKDHYEFGGLDDSYPTGPYYGNEIIHHRNDPNQQDNEIDSWDQVQTTRRNKPGNNGRPLTPTEIENMVLKAEKEALIKARLQKEKKRIHEENLRLQEQLNNALKIQEKLKQKTAAVMNVKSSTKPNRYNKLPASHFSQSPFVGPSYVSNQINPLAVQKSSDQFTPQQLQDKRIQSKQEAYIAYQQSQLQNIQNNQQDNPTDIVKFSKTKESNFDHDIYKTMPLTYDSFYSPILDKIDKIFTTLGFSDEPCRERLICSMYKNPPKFSPHSNLLSAELSRDSKDLQKPTSTNTAVIRFYRYVQAARDGQDKRDCMRLYPACQIDKEL